jgi:hypothetical protein
MGHERQPAADPLIAWLDGDRQPLRLPSEAEAAASLRRLMVEQESLFPDVDSERLARACWVLEKADKWWTPAVAIAWLKERPSHARLAVVLCLLQVAWTRSPRVPPPDPALVEDLLSTHDSLPYDGILENTLMIALVHASRAGLPAPLSARVRSILDRARKTPGRPLGIKEMLDTFLSTPPG